MTFRLREEQERDYHRLRQTVAAGHRRIIYQGPTGMGKTVISSHLLQQAVERGNPAMFMAPRRELITQCSEKLDENGIGYQVRMSNYGNGPGGDPVTLASADTLWARYKRFGASYLPPAKLIITDEAHLTSETRRKILDAYPDSVVIGLTATPARAQGKNAGMGLGDVFDELLIGPTYEELIQKGRLVPTRCFAPGDAQPNLEGVGRSGWDFNQTQTAERMGDGKLIGDVVRHWKELAENRLTLLFTSGVKQAMHTARRFEKNGVPADYIEGRFDTYERDETLQRFRRGEIRVLCNVGIAVYGLDIPEIGCIVDAAPTRSLVKFKQVAGRGMRPAPGKEDCLARGTKVLTDRGEVEIQHVTLNHKVWDGVQFVSHCGAICKGIQAVVTYDGVTATPDHKVMTDEGWTPISEAARRRLRITQSGNGGQPFRVPDDHLPKDDRKRAWASRRGGVRPVRTSAHDPLPQYAEATTDEGVPALQPPHADRSAEVAVSSLQLPEGSLREPKQQSLSEVWRSRNTLSVQECERSGYVDCAEHWPAIRSERPTRPNRQQRALRAGQPALVERSGTVGKQPTDNGGSPTLYSVPPELPTSTVCRFDSCPPDPFWDDGRADHQEVECPVYETQREVWDILNAGPLQRFTANGKLVHNCIYLDHAGNCMRHGLPDEDIEWFLEPNKRVEEEREKKEPPKTVTCGTCSAVFPKKLARCPECNSPSPKAIKCKACGEPFIAQQTCPHCGEPAPTQKLEELETEPGQLVEVKRRKANREATKDEKQKFWKQCLGVCINGNRKLGAAVHMYKQRYGVVPFKVPHLTPMPKGRDQWQMRARDWYNRFVAGNGGGDPA